MMKKRLFRAEDNKRKKEKRDNLDDNKREQMKNKDNKRKKEKRDNLHDNEKNN